MVFMVLPEPLTPISLLFFSNLCQNLLKFFNVFQSHTHISKIFSKLYVLENSVSFTLKFAQIFSKFYRKILKYFFKIFPQSLSKFRHYKYIWKFYSNCFKISLKRCQFSENTSKISMENIEIFELDLFGLLFGSNRYFSLFSKTYFFESQFFENFLSKNDTNPTSASTVFFKHLFFFENNICKIIRRE